MPANPFKSDVSQPSIAAPTCVSGSGAGNPGTGPARGRNVNTPDFERIVEAHYAALHRSGLSLARSESAAADLAQQAPYPAPSIITTFSPCAPGSCS